MTHTNSSSEGKKCVPSQLQYMSNPPKLRCVNCMRFWSVEERFPDCTAPISTPQEERPEGCECKIPRHLYKFHWDYCPLAPQDTDKDVPKCGDPRCEAISDILKELTHHPTCHHLTSPRSTATSRKPRDEKGDTHLKGCDFLRDSKYQCNCGLIPQHLTPSTEENFGEGNYHPDWQEDLRLKVNFDKNPDREVCILFIERHRQMMYKKGRAEAINQIKKWARSKMFVILPVKGKTSTEIVEDSKRIEREIGYNVALTDLLTLLDSI